MTKFEDILILHFEKYPLMTPQDAVKLCYQSAFGCGHLIKNEEFALSMLKKELDETESSFDAQLFEPIGSGYLRLNLHRAKNEGLPAEKICEIFIKSADEGEKTDLEPKLKLLQKLAKEGKTPFSAEELSFFLSGYNGEMLSHSEIYRKEYKPAYRVITEKLAKELQ
ncbi:MAG: hypothetical protein IJ945_05100 [Oscillospiraceae bacterium]|nr:hypothetical protein [Oscillospiraceae bacterium]